MAERLIDPGVIERRIEDLSAIGRVGVTGVTRTVFSREWVAAQDLLETWMRSGRNGDKAGCRRKPLGSARGVGWWTGDRQRFACRFPGAGRPVRRGARYHRGADSGRSTCCSEWTTNADCGGRLTLRGRGQPLPGGRFLGLARHPRPDLTRGYRTDGQFRWRAYWRRYALDRPRSGAHPGSQA